MGLWRHSKSVSVTLQRTRVSGKHVMEASKILEGCRITAGSSVQCVRSLRLWEITMRDLIGPILS